MLRPARLSLHFFAIALLLCALASSSKAQKSIYVNSDARVTDKNPLCTILLRGEVVQQQPSGGIKIAGKNWQFLGNLTDVQAAVNADGTVRSKMLLTGKLLVGKTVTAAKMTLTGTATDASLGSVGKVGIHITGIRQYSNVVYFTTGVKDSKIKEVPLDRGYLTIVIK